MVAAVVADHVERPARDLDRASDRRLICLVADHDLDPRLGRPGGGGVPIHADDPSSGKVRLPHPQAGAVLHAELEQPDRLVSHAPQKRLVVVGERLPVPVTRAGLDDVEVETELGQRRPAPVDVRGGRPQRLDSAAPDTPSSRNRCRAEIVGEPVCKTFSVSSISR